jgi:hypothetical protein
MNTKLTHSKFSKHFIEVCCYRDSKISMCLTTANADESLFQIQIGMHDVGDLFNMQAVGIKEYDHRLHRRLVKGAVHSSIAFCRSQ